MGANVTIEVDLESSEKSAKEIEKKAKKTGKKAGKKAGKNFTEGFSENVKSIGKTLAAVAAAAVAALAFKKLITNSVNAAAKLETLTVQFTTLFGSAKQAELQMKSLAEFAAATPFQIEGLAKATQTLISFGRTQQEAREDLTALGDVAAATGNDVVTLAQIFGQINSSSKLTGERFRQLAERGVILDGVLAKSLNTTKRNVAKMVSAGKISFLDFEKSFKSLTAVGGKFAGGMKRLSTTVTGLFSTLKDNTFLTFAKFGKALEPVTKFILNDMIESSKSFREGELNILIDLFKQFSVKVIDVAISAQQLRLAFEGLRLKITEIINSTSVSTDKFSVMVRVFAKGAKFVAGVFDEISEKTKKQVKELAAKGAEANKVLVGSVEKTISKLTELREKLSEVSNVDTDEAGKKDTPLTILQKELNSLLDKIKSFGASKLEQLDAQYAQELALLENKGALSVQSTEDIESAKTALLKKHLTDREKLLKKGDSIADKLNKSLSSSLSSGISKGIAHLATNLAQGKSLFDGFGSFLLKMLGDMAQQVGTMMIATGIGLLNLFSGNPAGLIAAGAGLVAIGALLSSFAGDATGPVAAPSGGGIASTLPEGSDDFDTSVTDQQEIESVSSGPSVSLTIQGDVIDSDQSGTRILQLLNDAFDTKGAVLSSNARFA